MTAELTRTEFDLLATLAAHPTMAPGSGRSAAPVLVQDALFHAEHAGHGVPAHHRTDPAVTPLPAGDLPTGTGST